MSQTYQDWLDCESYQDMIGESAVNDVLDCLRGAKPGDALAMLEEAIEKAWRAVQDKERQIADDLADAMVDPLDPYFARKPSAVRETMEAWERQRTAA